MELEFEIPWALHSTRVIGLDLHLGVPCRVLGSDGKMSCIEYVADSGDKRVAWVETCTLSNLELEQVETVFECSFSGLFQTLFKVKASSGNAFYSLVTRPDFNPEEGISPPPPKLAGFFWSCLEALTAMSWSELFPFFLKLKVSPEVAGTVQEFDHLMRAQFADDRVIMLDTGAMSLNAGIEVPTPIKPTRHVTDRYLFREDAAELKESGSNAKANILNYANKEIPPLPSGCRLRQEDLNTRLAEICQNEGWCDNAKRLDGWRIETLLSFPGLYFEDVAELVTKLTPYLPRRNEVQVGWSKARPEDDGRHLTATCSDTDEINCDDIDQLFQGDGVEALQSLLIKRLPRFTSNSRIPIDGLSTRAFNVCQREGWLEDASKLNGMILEDLLSVKNFGKGSLVNLLRQLRPLVESPMLEIEGIDRIEVNTKDATRVGWLVWPEIELLYAKIMSLRTELEDLPITGSDVRWGSLISSFGFGVDRLVDVCDKLLESHGGRVQWLKKSIEKLELMLGEINRARNIDLKTELHQIVKSIMPGVNGDIVIERLGFNGGGPKTLDLVGSTHGLTRERVRQICQKFKSKCDEVSFFTPVLDETLEVVENLCPTTIELAEEAISKCSDLNDRFSIFSLFEACAIFDKPVAFTVGDDNLVVLKDFLGDFSQRLKNVRRAVNKEGIGLIHQLREDLSVTLSEKELFEAVLKARSDFEWIDEDAGVFWLRGIVSSRYLNALRKVLSVCESIHVGELRNAISRHIRTADFPLNDRQTLAWCHLLDCCEVDGMLIRGVDLSPTEVLDKVELTLYRVLAQQDVAIKRSTFRRIVMAHGVADLTFSAYLSYSPIIAKAGTGLYSLCGTVQRIEIAHECGRTSRDSFWLQLRITNPVLEMSDFQTTAIPSDLDGVFEVHAHEGMNLRVGDGKIIGLLELLRHDSAHVGQWATIVFLPKVLIAFLILSDEAPESNEIEAFEGFVIEAMQST